MTTAFTSTFPKACRNSPTHGDRRRIPNVLDKKVGLEEFKASRRRDNIGQWMAGVPGLEVMAWFFTRMTYGRAEIVMLALVLNKPGAEAEVVAQDESIVGKSTHPQGIPTRKGNLGEVEDAVQIGGDDLGW